MLVHLYGQGADIKPILAACQRDDVALIEDAADALGASYKDRSPGTLGKAGIFYFNGNKIITTSGGGMLVSDDGDFIAHARKLATQARDPAPHYQHSELGYNYRMSNLLAAVGRGQLQALGEIAQARRRNFAYYQAHLGDLPGIAFMPEAPWGRHTRWLTVLTIDSARISHVHRLLVVPVCQPAGLASHLIHLIPQRPQMERCMNARIVRDERRLQMNCGCCDEAIV